MLRGIAQRFLNDTKKSERRTTGQIPDALVGLTRNWNTDRGAELLAVRVHRLGQSGLLQERRVQVMRKLPQIRARLDELLLHFVNGRRGIGIRRNPAFGRAQHHGRGQHFLHHAIVQLAGNPNPLLLLRLHQPLVERADFTLMLLDDA